MATAPSAADAGNPVADDAVVSAAAQTAAAADANQAAATSSDAGEQGAKNEPDLRSVIKKVIEDGDKAAEASPATDGSKVEPAPGADGAEAKPDAKADGEAEAKPDATDKDNVPFHNHPRWKEVLKERDEALAARDTYQADAEEHAKVRTFMEGQNLAPSEVAEGFVVMAQLKNEPRKAYAYFKQLVTDLEVSLGITLPADLQEKVESGAVSEDVAAETARLRADTAQAKAIADRDAEKRTRQEAETATNTRNATFSKAANAWEADRARLDPDYPNKAKAVERFARSLLVERGMPATAIAAVQLLEDAYAEVNKTFGAPVKAATTPTPSAAGSSPIGTPVPKTLADAVRAGLAAS